MNSEQKTQILTTVMVIGIFLVVIISILALIAIWTPKKQQEEKIKTQEDLQVGEYVSAYISEEEVLKKYFSNIFAKMISEEYTELYSMLDEEYKEKTNINIEQFSEKMRNMQMGGKHLIFDSYNSIVYGGQNIYIINLKTADNKVYDKIIVKESSPEQYTLSFDNIIHYTDEQSSIKKEGINLTFKSVLYTTEEIVFEINVQNLSGTTIQLNSKNLPEGIYIVDSNRNTIKPNQVVFGGQNITLNDKKDIHLELRYKMDNTQYKDVKNLVLKNIWYEDTGTVKDIEFEL